MNTKDYIASLYATGKTPEEILKEVTDAINDAENAARKTAEALAATEEALIKGIGDYLALVDPKAAAIYETLDKHIILDNLAITVKTADYANKLFSTATDSTTSCSCANKDTTTATISSLIHDLFNL